MEWTKLFKVFLCCSFHRICCNETTISSLIMSLSIGRTARNCILILPHTIFLSGKYISSRRSEVFKKKEGYLKKLRNQARVAAPVTWLGRNKVPVDRIQKNNKINAKSQALNPVPNLQTSDDYLPRSNTATWLCKIEKRCWCFPFLTKSSRHSIYFRIL